MERTPIRRLVMRGGLAAAAFLLVACAQPAVAEIEADTAARLAALRNDARAREHGEGVPRDPVRAAALYCEAARLGDAEAQFSLGWMYANGRGIGRDNRMASLFFAMAAEQGHEYAKKVQACVGGSLAGLPCEADADCPSGTCTGTTVEGVGFTRVVRLEKSAI